MLESGQREKTASIPLEVREWLSLNPQPPIWASDISDWKQWIEWHPHQPGFGHYGHDIAAYLNKRDEVVIGLPPNTLVYPVAPGIVAEINNLRPDKKGDYWIRIIVEHVLPRRFSFLPLLGRKKSLFSEYWHLTPTVKIGQKVLPEKEIGHLYADSGQEEGRLVHLHLLTRNGPELFDSVNPTRVIPEITGPACIPLGKLKDFTIENMGKLPIRIANFRKLMLRESEGR